MDGSRATTGACWFVGALASALVLLFALTAAGPAHATSDGTATLWLDPFDGPPGTKVIATAWGYAECHASDATSPSPARRGVARADAGGGVVKVFWEGVEEAVGSAVVPASGVVEVPFAVPAEATAHGYSIVSLCMTNSKLKDDGVLMVTGAETPGVVPPTVPSETVRPPSVSPPTVVPPGTATPQTVSPHLVRVPRVVGLKAADANAKLSALGLVLRVTSGDGEVVASQSPTAGSMVGVGHAVRITIRRAVVAAPQLVLVPNLVGEQVAAARSALSVVGLRLGGTAEVDRDIASQQPAPGTLVAAGTTITVAFAKPFPWSAAALLSLVVLTGAVTYRGARQRLDQRWVRNKLRVVVPPAPAVDARITDSEPAPPMPVVRIEPHADAGIHILKGD